VIGILLGDGAQEADHDDLAEVEDEVGAEVALVDEERGIN
jgi:hypothetical protein